MSLEVGGSDEVGQVAFDISTIEETYNSPDKEHVCINSQSTSSFNDRQERLRTETLYNIQLHTISSNLLDIIIKYGNNPEGVPPLLYAIKQNDLYAVKTLIEHGANLETACFSKRDFRKPFNVSEYAAAYGSNALLAFLDNCGVNFETVFYPLGEYDYYSSSPINIAAYHNNTTALKFIAEKGIDIKTMHNPNQMQGFNNSPIQLAIMGNSFEAFKTLIELGVDITKYMNENENIVICAANYGAVSILRFLFEQGFSPNPLGDTPYGALYSVLINHPNHPNTYEVIKVLLEHGAKVSEQDFQQALNNSNPQLIELLLEYSPSLAKNFKF